MPPAWRQRHTLGKLPCTAKWYQQLGFKQVTALPQVTPILRVAIGVGVQLCAWSLHGGGVGHARPLCDMGA